MVAGAASGLEESDENRLAVASYARAMDHVGVMALDPTFEWADRVILDLHFDACYFQRDKSPGHWRTGPIGVTAPRRDARLPGPDAEEVVPLMREVVEWLRTSDPEEHVVVRAAMAHLHVVSVHPFRDGNGRISRIVQSLVLARDGLLSPSSARSRSTWPRIPRSTTPCCRRYKEAAISRHEMPRPGSVSVSTHTSNRHDSGFARSRPHRHAGHISSASSRNAVGPTGS